MLDHVEGNTNLAGSVSGGASSPNDADATLPTANGNPVDPSTPERLATPKKPATSGSAPSPSPSRLTRYVNKVKDPAATANALVGFGRTVAHGYNEL